MRKLLFVMALAGCGGGKKSVVEPKQPSECEVIGGHVADVVLTFKDPPPASRDVIAEVVKNHCEADAWSADSKQCFASFIDESAAAGCIKSLTDDQHDKVRMDLEGRTKKPMSPEAPATESAPPADSGDPCEGGE